MNPPPPQTMFKEKNSLLQESILFASLVLVYLFILTSQQSSVHKSEQAVGTGIHPSPRLTGLVCFVLFAIDAAWPITPWKSVGPDSCTLLRL